MPHTADGKPLEIERKYLIEIPDLDVLSSQPNYSRSEIEQIYLSEGGRIRMRRYLTLTEDNSGDCTAEKVKYYRTYKESVGGISRIEIENEITAQEYMRLSEHKAVNTRAIHKVRHCFTYGELLFELDIYDFWDDKATLEVELESEEQAVSIPPFISVIRDVSCDKAYTNFALSRAQSNGVPYPCRP